MARVTWRDTPEIELQLSLYETRILANFLLLNLPVDDDKSTPAQIRNKLQDVVESFDR